MEIQFIKEAPPAIRKFGVTAEIVEALKAKPGAWAIVYKFEGKEAVKAGSKASYLRKAGAGNLEARSRDGIVYARFVEGAEVKAPKARAKK